MGLTHGRAERVAISMRKHTADRAMTPGGVPRWGSAWGYDTPGGLFPNPFMITGTETGEESIPSLPFSTAVITAASTARLDRCMASKCRRAMVGRPVS